MRRGENIYKRKDGRWEGRYKKGYKPNGRIKYGYIYGKTLTEVRSQLYAMKAYYNTRQELYGNVCIPFEEWGHQWLNEIQQGIKPATYTSYYYKLTKYVFPYIGEYDLNELKLENGKHLVNQWIEKGLEVSTMQVILGVAKQCLYEAQKQEYLKENPFRFLKLPKMRKKPIRALTWDEQNDLEKAALSRKNHTGLPTYLALHTGLRIGEIAALKWSDIDFKRDIITVNQTYQRVALAIDGQKTQLNLGTTKTESGTRSVPIGRPLKKQLLSYRRKAKGDHVFSTKGHPVEPRLLTYHFHQLRKQCGLEDIHFHQLRHTFATRCLEEQSDIKSVSDMMGHRSTQLTLDTYADSMMEQRIKVIYQMETALCARK
ncbi:site-specific integrase [Enterococcus hulanensis]|uniref:tyrosine-type recombinase/integrase n=1 Tax=Enterococcus hulanensis TaxID=2559929 RepID=UPI001A8F6B2C|nr:site-specific integrase [Enterococcus hulanensis]MBO0457553.1 site-specific integrase [Enterococcus hulanensis]